MLKSYIRYRMADKEIDDIIELMKISGISRNTINKFFHGENIKTLKLETLIKICDSLDCKLSDLIEYTPEK